MYSIYNYPVDAGCSSHARDNIKSYIFFFALSSMETIVVSTRWLVFISIFNYFAPTWNKDNNNNNVNIAKFLKAAFFIEHLWWVCDLKSIVQNRTVCKTFRNNNYA